MSGVPSPRLYSVKRSIAGESDRCPFALGWRRRCVETGEVQYFRCRRNRCEHCLRVNALVTARALAAAKPERFVTLTRVGDEWPTVRGRMKSFRHEIASQGYRFDWAWLLEANPKGTGHHVHALQHGDYVPLPVLRRAAIRQGMGSRVVPERIRNVGQASHYAAKAAAGYASKEAVRSFELNGGRQIAHTSRDYWRQPGGKREAVRRVVDEYFSEREQEGRTWVIEPDGTTDPSTSCSVRMDTSSSSIWLRPGRLNAPGVAGAWSG